MKFNDAGWVEDLETSIVHKKAVCQSHPLVADNVRFVMAHWTGGSSFDSAMNWLSSEKAKASAHFVLGRDGKVGQLVSVESISWHAGTSSYSCVHPVMNEALEFTKLNRHSIGLEFVNLGRLKKTEAGTFLSSTGRVVPATEVVLADDNRYYQAYTNEQLASGLELMLALKERFPKMFDVIGHSDVAPERKIDPGPEFPFGYFRSKVFGVRGDDDGDLVA